MIRFSAALVVVAVGVLVGGMATSGLLLVYVAIGLGVVALLTLALGVALNREEIFGEQRGQSALAGQGANVGFQGANVGFGQAAWAAAPVTHAGRPGDPEAEIPLWGERFASPAPQQPAAQTRADAGQTRVDLAKARTDLAETRTDLTETKAGLTETKIDLTAVEEDADDVEETDDAEDTTELSEPSVASPEAEAEAPEAEAEAEDSAPTDVTDSSPDDDQDSDQQGDQEGRSGQREVTVVPGVPRYHDASCILIRFMGDDDLQKMTLDKATEAGCTPCKACMPEHA